MSSIDSEEEERKEEMRKQELYQEFYQTKIFLKAYNRKNFEFDLKFPKSSYDRIMELYGHEAIVPLSFVLFSNPYEVTETIRYLSKNINVRSSVQINSMLDLLNNYYVYPTSYEGLDEIEKINRAPKLKSKYLNNIANKMSLSYSEMINYISLQLTEIDVTETMKTVISKEVYQLIFNLIHLLKVKFPNKESFELAFYSYRKILNMAEIELDKIIPYLDVFSLENITRQEVLFNEKSKLLDKIRIRELKELIDVDLRKKNIDLYAGIDSCERMPKCDPFELEPFREEASKLLWSFIKEENEEEEKEDEGEENEVIEENNDIQNDNEEENKEKVEPEKTNEEKPEQINAEETNENKEKENSVEIEIKEPEKPPEEEKKEVEPEKPSEEENKKDNENPEEIKIEEPEVNKIDMTTKIESKDIKDSPENDNIIEVENITSLNQDQNKENDEKKEDENNKIIGEQITVNTPNLEGDDLNKNKITGETITNINIENEPEKDNDNIIISEQTILRARNDSNKEKNKDGEKPNIVSGQSITTGGNKPNKNEEEELSKNKIITKKLTNENETKNAGIKIIGGKKIIKSKKQKEQVKDNNNEEKNKEDIIKGQTLVSGSNDIGKNPNNNQPNINNNDNIPKTQADLNKIQTGVGKTKKAKKQFKIRRVVFVKVEK